MEEHHDEWYTRVELFKELCTRYAIFPKMDVAANDTNHMCDDYFTESDNALEQEWVIGESHYFPGDLWMNPPLLKGNTKRFVLKAYEQWQRYNMNILSIVPSGVISRNWFRPLWDNFITKGGITIDPIKRPSFLDHGDEPKFAARNDYIALIFRKH